MSTENTGNTGAGAESTESGQDQYTLQDPVSQHPTIEPPAEAIALRDSSVK
jgi:hypothetical protein